MINKYVDICEERKKERKKEKPKTLAVLLSSKAPDR
jgi:hypothetical protein